MPFEIHPFVVETKFPVRKDSFMQACLLAYIEGELEKHFKKLLKLYSLMCYVWASDVYMSCANSLYAQFKTRCCTFVQTKHCMQH